MTLRLPDYPNDAEPCSHLNGCHPRRVNGYLGAGVSVWHVLTRAQEGLLTHGKLAKSHQKIVLITVQTSVSEAPPPCQRLQKTGKVANCPLLLPTRAERQNELLLLSLWAGGA